LKLDKYSFILGNNNTGNGGRGFSPLAPSSPADATV